MYKHLYNMFLNLDVAFLLTVCIIVKLYFCNLFVARDHRDIWATTGGNLCFKFLTKKDSNQVAHLQRLAKIINIFLYLYHSLDNFQKANNKCADQTVRTRS